MQFFDSARIRELLPWEALIQSLRTQFQEKCNVPVRHHHSFSVPDEEAGTLLLMPSWQEGRYIGVKVVTVVPGNSVRRMPSVDGAYLLLSARTGTPIALFDGAELTARRTAAASALAASYLAPSDADTLLIVGAGKLSLNLIEAHSAVRPIAKVIVWARRPQQAKGVARSAQLLGYKAVHTEDLKNAVLHSRIISCCTLSEAPLVHGSWLQPGTHLDLVGAFKPTMRECDDEAVRRATIFVDTVEGATMEGGDIAQPIAAGVIAREDIAAELPELCRCTHLGRTSDREITLFKSVGTAIADLAAATAAVRAAA